MRTLFLVCIISQINEDHPFHLRPPACLALLITNKQTQTLQSASTMMESTRSLQRGSGGSHYRKGYSSTDWFLCAFGVIIVVALLLLFSVSMWGGCHRCRERRCRSSKRLKKMALKKIRKGVVVTVRK